MDRRWLTRVLSASLAAVAISGVAQLPSSTAATVRSNAPAAHRVFQHQRSIKPVLHKRHPTQSRVKISTSARPSSSGRSSALVGSLGLGVYAGPDQKGVQAETAFDAFMGTKSTETLEYPPTNSWSQIEGQSWLIGPHVAQSERLEYSVPVVPDIKGTSLAACANGEYDVHWSKLARNMINFGFASAVIRPGWEFNGSWYRWSAISDPASFASCFRHVVTSMRSIPGQNFTFDWNVNIGYLNNFAAEQAWPGDQYVDVVGVDTYDSSYGNYIAIRATSLADHLSAINEIINGNHGLKFWSSFAAVHGKTVALTEWGLSWLSNGHGGGDDPAYIVAMFRYMRDPSNLVSYEHYMNQAGTTSDHQLTPQTRFPLSLAQFRSCIISSC